MAGSITIVADSRLNRLIVQGTARDVERIETYLAIVDKDNDGEVDYEEFEEWWQHHHAVAAERRPGALSLHSRKQSGNSAADKHARIAERERKKAAEKERRRLTNQVARLEKQIEEAEQRRTELESELERAYGDDGHTGRAQQLAEDLKRQAAHIESLYEDWERAVSLLSDG